MALNLHEFKPIETTDFQFLTEWSDKLYQRKYPRFYECLMRYSHQPHVFKWAIVDECLCIIKKRQIMGTPVCYLMLPPMGPNSRLVMEKFQWEKISTLLSEEDIDLMSIS